MLKTILSIFFQKKSLSLGLAITSLPLSIGNSAVNHKFNFPTLKPTVDLEGNKLWKFIPVNLLENFKDLIKYFNGELTWHRQPFKSLLLKLRHF